ncbi:lipoprotein [Pseudoxanthomonas sp. NC8]|nr:lipoprotein [Pseudoxanthomonas sp. NC8]
MNAKPLIAATAIALLLAACGNKGPLVMPQKPVPVEEPAPTDTPVEPAPATAPATVEPAPPADGTHG